MVIATDAGLLSTASDLRPHREEQHPNAGQSHEYTPVNWTKKGGRKKQRNNADEHLSFLSYVKRLHDPS